MVQYYIATDMKQPAAQTLFSSLYLEIYVA